jgi:hypothetical protein
LSLHEGLTSAFRGEISGNPAQVRSLHEGAATAVRVMAFGAVLLEDNTATMESPARFGIQGGGFRTIFMGA